MRDYLQDVIPEDHAATVDDAQNVIERADLDPARILRRHWLLHLFDHQALRFVLLFELHDLPRLVDDDDGGDSESERACYDGGSHRLGLSTFRE